MLSARTYEPDEPTREHFLYVLKGAASRRRRPRRCLRPALPLRADALRAGGRGAAGYQHDHDHWDVEHAHARCDRIATAALAPVRQPLAPSPGRCQVHRYRGSPTAQT
jgi:hypothetical protein